MKIKIEEAISKCKAIELNGLTVFWIIIVKRMFIITIVRPYLLVEIVNDSRLLFTTNGYKLHWIWDIFNILSVSQNG